MLKEEKFNLDIENIKCDLAIEDMKITDEDVELLKRYSNKEITMTELVDTIKKSTLERIK